ncbi:hypothetical protein PDJAM_G00163320 [Pangasius djambal]|uniref:Uncharacterized protein n=1 Tax=Pangasius djambal TaxID=1691987 RepID=A0ACC5ZJW0_9TELE|nr:hypothetical protein [Pangasius djambal]
MGKYSFGNAGFTKKDVYVTIQAYLTTATPPKCYNPSDPMLNSMAWFYQYIGVFITFITVDDLQRLPTQFWCSAPASAFSNLSQSYAVNITKSLQQQCTDIDPTVSAALAGNVHVLTANTILALGNSITSLSVGQIESSSPSTLLSTLSFLSSVVGWSQSQAMAIVQSLLSAGVFKITSVESLQQLGSLLKGIPSTLFSYISAATLLSALQSQAFLNNTLTTSITTQQTIVNQLTCMYNYIKSDNLTVFTDYPADMLLYYNLSRVQPSVCQAYYSALGEADFSVFSSTLAFRRDILFTNARQCLGVSGLSVNRTQLDVMGHMVCVFNSSYVLNSDPYVLEKLKLCATLTGEQSSAVEKILLSGNTIYGTPASWNQTTLSALGVLPLYLTSNFWAYFTQKEKVDFLRVFVPSLKVRGISRNRISTLITEAGKVSNPGVRSLLRFRRDTACTVGEITQIQASDDSFPFGYDVNQFNACLSVQTLKDNLATITDKAAGSDFQRVILDKLNQAYPAGISDAVLQVLGPASRAASTSDISKWSVTTIDTLSALMRSYDGAWSPEQVRAIVSRYVSGNRTLGSLELNALGGTNLCALSTSLLKTISSISLQLAGALSVSTCSVEQKQALFSIAQLAFSDQTLSKSTKATNTVSANTYQLIQTYLGGADISYVHTLSISNISMDLLTFITLDQNVVDSLTVSEVRGLLGTNLPDLKVYENSTVVHSWVTRQLQSDLNTLGIGLTGGRVTPTATTASANANTNSSANASATTATTTKPTGAGSSISASSGLQKLLLFLGVTMATLQLIH